ncbi:MAG: hypothetical protein Q7S02_01680 [bacterium]|nr:hypothetical protein [bacterium]
MRKLGSIFTTAGGVFGILCPACIPALGAFLATIGLGFLANFVVSRTITLTLLGLALVALHMSSLVHRRSSAFVLAVVAAMGMIAGRNFVLNQWLIYASGAGLLAAAILDYSYRRRAPAVTCAPVPRTQ